MARQGRTVLRQVEFIDAKADIARELLLDPERWAPLLPHVELANIHYQDNERRVVRFRARRLWWWPVWLLVEMRDEGDRITIRHLAGAGKGAIEHWQMQQISEDQMQLELALIASGVSARSRSWLIVAPLAARTFQMIAMLAEAEEMVDQSMPGENQVDGVS